MRQMLLIFVFSSVQLVVSKLPNGVSFWQSIFPLFDNSDYYGKDFTYWNSYVCRKRISMWNGFFFVCFFFLVKFAMNFWFVFFFFANMFGCMFFCFFLAFVQKFISGFGSFRINLVTIFFCLFAVPLIPYKVNFEI